MFILINAPMTRDIVVVTMLPNHCEGSVNVYTEQPVYSDDTKGNVSRG